MRIESVGETEKNKSIPFNAESGGEGDILKNIIHFSALIPKSEGEAKEIERKLRDLRNELDLKRGASYKQNETSIH